VIWILIRGKALTGTGPMVKGFIGLRAGLSIRGVWMGVIIQRM
jgi:hypothetical protein